MLAARTRSLRFRSEMSSRLPILAVAAASSLCACSTLPRLSVSTASIDACIAGTTCVVSGELRLHQGEPAWAALVVAGDKCAKLALPDDFYTDAGRWNGTAVEVVGEAFEQPDFDRSSELIVLWYLERDRKLSLGVCDGGVGIYVHSLRSRNGRLWPSDAR